MILSFAAYIVLTGVLMVLVATGFFDPLMVGDAKRTQTDCTSTVAGCTP